MFDYELIVDLFESLSYISKTSDQNLENLIWIIKYLAMNDPANAVRGILKSFNFSKRELKKIRIQLDKVKPVNHQSKDKKTDKTDKLLELIDELDHTNF